MAANINFRFIPYHLQQGEHVLTLVLFTTDVCRFDQYDNMNYGGQVVSNDFLFLDLWQIMFYQIFTFYLPRSCRRAIAARSTWPWTY